MMKPRHVAGDGTVFLPHSHERIDTAPPAEPGRLIDPATLDAALAHYAAGQSAGG